ncbi:MAG: DUF4358 domain-containing protein [Clostridia bacterium]|nr:DUF4358 domain-containing protein [Clostridia bacterium]
MNKKVISIVIAVVVVVALVVLAVMLMGNKPQEHVEGTLTDLMTKLYANIPEDELPMLANTEVTAENVEYFLGTADVQYTEALASEPMMSSIAHSVVLVRVPEDANVEEVKEKIKTNVDPVKWLCVSVDPQNVKVENRGNLVVLIMDNEKADQILENFNQL